jgi:hypothetical protein
MVAERFVQAVEVVGNGGGKAEQREIAEEHSVSVFFLPSSRRRPGSSAMRIDDAASLSHALRRWIPAYAGMTK